MYEVKKSKCINILNIQINFKNNYKNPKNVCINFLIFITTNLIFKRSFLLHQFSLFKNDIFTYIPTVWSFMYLLIIFWSVKPVDDLMIKIKIYFKNKKLTLQVTFVFLHIYFFFYYLLCLFNRLYLSYFLLVFIFVFFYVLAIVVDQLLVYNLL